MDIAVNIPQLANLKQGGRIKKGTQLIELRVEATAETQYRTRCQEKPLRMLSNPYRKPTQVGG